LAQSTGQQPAPGPGRPGEGGDGGSGADSSGDGGGRPERDRPGGGIQVGRPFGVPVYVTPTWFLIAALITWVFGSQLRYVLPWLGGARYLVALFYAVAFYASVLVHELAHTVLALRFRLPVRRIQLQFFGGVSEIEKEAESPGREFWLAFVGPLLSLVLGVFFYLLLQLASPGGVVAVLLAGLMISNVIVAIFNLLPGLPLDGGRMLRAAVWKLTRNPMSGTVAAAWAGRVLAIAVVVGLPWFSYSRRIDHSVVDTLTDTVLAVVLGGIMWQGAGGSLRVARLRERLPYLEARALCRPALSVTADTPVSEVLRRTKEQGARGVVVTDRSGAPIALVRERSVAQVPEQRRPWTAVGAIARDLEPGLRIRAELRGEDLLDRLRAAPATEYLVEEADGSVLGVLSATDVEQAFSRAMAGRPPTPGGPSAPPPAAPSSSASPSAASSERVVGGGPELP
jgi:Zn-dependent protease/CBS domain-containing protein